MSRPCRCSCRSPARSATSMSRSRQPWHRQRVAVHPRRQRLADAAELHDQRGGSRPLRRLHQYGLIRGRRPSRRARSCHHRRARHGYRDLDGRNKLEVADCRTTRSWKGGDALDHDGMSRTESAWPADPSAPPSSWDTFLPWPGSVVGRVDGAGPSHGGGGRAVAVSWMIRRGGAR